MANYNIDINIPEYMKKLEEYIITIDPKYAEGGEDLGIEQIAFVTNPAVKVKGMAFAGAVKQYYTDEPKMRIIAPALIPMSIYRNDEMGEYFVKFTESEIEEIHKKFMANLSNRDKFNTEHDEKATAPAYVLEAWLVEDPEMDKSRAYGIDVPKGTLMVVAQVTDKDYYNTLIKEDRVGFSIEGFLGMRFHELNMEASSSPVNNKSRQTMKSSRTKRKLFTALAFAEGVLAPIGTITVIADELKPGAVALVIDENGKPVEDYTGDILVNDTLVTLEKGKITDAVSGDTEMEEVKEEIKEEVKMTTEEEKMEEEEKKEEMGLDVLPSAKAGSNPEEEKKMGGMKKGYEVEEETDGQKEAEVAMAIDETELLTILQPKFDEIYKLIADLKVVVDAMKSEEESDEEEIEVAPLTVAQKLSAALNFLQK